MTRNPRRPKSTPATGRNKWTYEQRVCLLLLWTHERSPSISERTHAFNSIFQDHQRACGVPIPGLEAKTLKAQYAELLHTTDKATWKPTWGNVRNAPDTDQDRALRARLSAQIASLLQDGENIDVARDLTTPPETPRRTGRVRKATQNPYFPYTDEDPITPVRSHQVSAQGSAVLNPYATPGPSTRKRPAAAPIPLLPGSDDDDSSEDDEDDFPRVKRAMRSSPEVMVSPPPQEVIDQTPRTLEKTSRRPGATMLYHRMLGGPIWLTPLEYAEAMLPLVNVTEEAAHPNPPALLFRYWHRTESHGINSETGFVSGRSSRSLVEFRGPPDCDALEWNDVALHLNNAGNDQAGVPSPFISTSNLFIWVLRMALKKADDDAYISVIDTSKLKQKSIFHVLPFFEALKKKRIFFKGGFIYRGTFEHLIWDSIPGSAIIKTFGLNDITALSNSNRIVKQVLRLDQLAVAKSSATDIIKTLKEHNIKIGGRVAAAIAELVIFLGLDHTSSREMLSRAVYEIVQGWVLKADGRSQEKAEEFSKVFMVKLFTRTGEFPSSSDQSKLKHAFLHGIHWSCGDLNVHLKGRAGYQVMEKNASKRGLTDPGRYLSNELNQERRKINGFEMQQQRLQMRARDRLAVEEQEEAEQLDDDNVADDIVPRQMRRLNLEGFIRYE